MVPGFVVGTGFCLTLLEIVGTCNPTSSRKMESKALFFLGVLHAPACQTGKGKLPWDEIYGTEFTKYVYQP